VATHLKIVAAVLALLILLGTIGGAFYAWEKIFKPDMYSKREVRKELDASAPRADPGKAVYEAAIEDIRQGRMADAQDNLRQIIKIYRDSASFQDARRVLGEIHLDRLFSKAPMPGKLEYTVNRDPGLESIAKKHQTTVAFLRKVNGLGGTTIHPGDRLIVYPLDFEVEVNVAQKRLTVKKAGEYFKDYAIQQFDLPAGVRPPSKTFLDSKPAYVADKQIRESDNRFGGARKWLQTKGSPGRPGVNFCVRPKKAGDSAPNGIYLEEADIEELCTILKVGTQITFQNS
jgi:hypothetical protein